MQTTETGFIVSKADLKAILAFACEDETRGHLACVRFVPCEGTMVATDGHTLCKVSNGGAYDAEPFSVSARVLKGALRGTGRNAECSIRCDGETAKISWSDGTGATTAAPVDASLQYPPYEQVIPSRARNGEPARRIGFNAQYLARLALVQKAARPDARGGIEFAIHACGELDPARADISGQGCDWTVVLMPVRI